MVVSRIMRDGEEFVPNQDTVLKADDKVLIVTTQKHVDSIRIIFGAEIPMHHVDWLNGKKTVPSLKRLGITKSSLTGKKLGEILLHCHYSVTVTRVVRSGVELVASPELRVQVGDYLQVVGTKEGIDDIAKMVGNKASALDKPNLLPIFLGITSYSVRFLFHCQVFLSLSNLVLREDLSSSPSCSAVSARVRTSPHTRR